jgi:hypothetical protein
MHINNNTGPWFESIADSNQGHKGHILSTHFPGYLSPTNSDQFIVCFVETLFPSRFFQVYLFNCGESMYELLDRMIRRGDDFDWTHVVSLMKGGGTGEHEEGSIRWGDLSRRDRDILNLYFFG